ncbi:hypothetical protein [Halorubrum vacuolatum]|nr:hypothetical protein [Halorubrum vacuolatum]
MGEIVADLIWNGSRCLRYAFPNLLPSIVAGRDPNRNLLNFEYLRDCESMPSVNEQIPTIPTDIDRNLIVSIESIATDIHIRRYIIALDEFPLAAIALLTDTLIQSIDVSTGVPYFALT